MRTQVVNLKTDPYQVYIGRGSEWGNPFRIGVDGDRQEVIEMYEYYIRSHPEKMKRLHTLQGKVLGCYCKPEDCHGDILIKLMHEMLMEQYLQSTPNQVCTMQHHDKDTFFLTKAHGCPKYGNDYVPCTTFLPMEVGAKDNKRMITTVQEYMDVFHKGETQIHPCDDCDHSVCRSRWFYTGE